MTLEWIHIFDHLFLQGCIVIVTLSFDEFSMWHWAAFSFLIFLAFKAVSGFFSADNLWQKTFKFDYIPPVKMLKDEDLDFTHHLYTTINRCVITPLYIYHMSQYMAYQTSAGNVEWDLKQTLYGIIPATLQFLFYFAFYDLVYVAFHRTIHIPAIYPYIHKHHHHQVSPFRGTYDGINTHPFEFFCGEYLFLGCTFAAGYVWNTIYAMPYLTYFIISSVCASLNHTRSAVYFPFFYDVRDHDVHHRIPRSNYGQVVMWWDKVFGSFHEYFDNRKRREAEKSIAKELAAKSAQQSDRIAEEKLTVVDLPKLKQMPSKCVVTGGCGMVGSRLMEMLLECGCEKVVCIDIKNEIPSNIAAKYHRFIELINVDITDLNALTASKAFENADCVFHVAALVGPYFKHELYYSVNVTGTVNVVECCKKFGVKALVDCSSPSTRYDGNDINGLDEADFLKRGGGRTPYAHEYGQSTHEYARTKALGEKTVLLANGTAFDDKSGQLFTSVIAPHQIYGPNDQLFLKSMYEKAKQGMVRIAGNGNYYVSFTHVDNVCSALILACKSLLFDDKNVVPMAAGQFYFVTDGGAFNFWDAVDELIVKQMNLSSLRTRFYVEPLVLYAMAYLGVIYTAVTGRFVKLTPFAVRMITINRYFCIGKIERELKYEPLKPFRDAWTDTLTQFVANQSKQ